MILEFDCGNTAVKWRAGHLSGRIAWSALGSESNWCWEPLALPPSVDRIRMGSVAGDRRTRALCQYLQGRYGCEPELARVVDGCNGIRCGYGEPDRLGVDRWLAIQAAMATYPDSRLLVVDAGSAITLEVCEPGRHLGGFIGPGLQLMRNALYSGTHAVKVLQVSDACPALPATDTKAAVSGALALMCVGFVREAVRRFGPLDHLVFTGGSGEGLWTEFDSAHYAPELVLDGLALVLP